MVTITTSYVDNSSVIVAFPQCSENANTERRNMDKVDTSILFTLPNGTRWITKTDSPLSIMLAETVKNIMKAEDDAQPRTAVDQRP